VNRLIAAPNHFVVDPLHQLQRRGEELVLVVLSEQLELLVWCHAGMATATCLLVEPSLARLLIDARVARLDARGGRGRRESRPGSGPVTK
jgi:hypothetical protein